MNKIVILIQSYIFWLTWSIITGGIIIIGPVLAPIAFTTMPVTVSPEMAQYAYSYAGTLFTLFFIQYFPIVAGAFLLITILEQFYIFKRWKEHRINVILCEIILLSGNMIWMWLAFKLAPQMESMVMNLESWNDISVRESFAGLHSQSQSLAEIGLLITMILPWLTRISVFRPSSSAN